MKASDRFVLGKRVLIFLMILLIGKSGFAMDSSSDRNYNDNRETELIIEKQSSSSDRDDFVIDALLCEGGFATFSLLSALENESDTKWTANVVAYFSYSFLVWSVIGSGEMKKRESDPRVFLTGAGLLAIAKYNWYYAGGETKEKVFKNNFIAYNLLAGILYFASPKQEEEKPKPDCQLQQTCQQQPDWRPPQQSNLNFYLIPDGIAFNYRF